MPIKARVVWAEDGEEQVETVALGWAGRNVYVRMEGPRYRVHGGVAGRSGRDPALTTTNFTRR